MRFERSDWWDANWESAEIAMPDELRMLPVTEISYESAVDYAQWAGMRLPTEFEYQRAVRRGTRDLYPWGDEWEHFVAITSEERSSDPYRVGSRPANRDGIHDLAGNVWEWTSSPYEPFERFKNSWLELPDGRRIDLVCDWDPNKRVTVGGSYKSEPLAARATTRRATERFQTTEALGFRCATSVQPGLDRARGVVYFLRRSIRPEIDFDAVVAIDRWRAGMRSGEQPASYAVVTAYEYLLFAPVRELEAHEARGLELDTSDGELVKLGVLSTSLDIVSPPIGTGTWIVGWRALGRDAGELVFLGQNGEELFTAPHDELARSRVREGRVARWTNEPRAQIEATIPYGRRGYELRLPLEVLGLEGSWRQ